MKKVSVKIKEMFVSDLIEKLKHYQCLELCPKLVDNVLMQLQGKLAPIITRKLLDDCGFDYKTKPLYIQMAIDIHLLTINQNDELTMFAGQKHYGNFSTFGDHNFYKFIEKELFNDGLLVYVRFPIINMMNI